MAEIYSRSLVVKTITSSGDNLLLVCPPGKTLVLRTLVLGNASNTDAVLTLFVVHGTDSAWLFRGDLAPLETFHMEMRAVLEPGDELHLDMPVEAATVYVGGYEFG